MPHTYAAHFVHCVFSTKGRRDLIPDELEEKPYAYLIGIARHLRVTLIAAGGTSNHIHLLVGLPPALPLAEVVQKMKANSSRWMSEHGIAFEWQKGYGAFSASPSLLYTVQAYIRNQKEHHKRHTFEEEFLTLLRKSGIDCDVDEVFAAQSAVPAGLAFPLLYPALTRWAKECRRCAANARKPIQHCQTKVCQNRGANDSAVPAGLAFPLLHPALTRWANECRRCAANAREPIQHCQTKVCQNRGASDSVVPAGLG